MKHLSTSASQKIHWYSYLPSEVHFQSIFLYQDWDGFTKVIKERHQKLTMQQYNMERWGDGLVSRVEVRFGCHHSHLQTGDPGWVQLLYLQSWVELKSSKRDDLVPCVTNTSRSWTLLGWNPQKDIGQARVFFSYSIYIIMLSSWFFFRRGGYYLWFFLSSASTPRAWMWWRQRDMLWMFSIREYLCLEFDILSFQWDDIWIHPDNKTTRVITASIDFLHRIWGGMDLKHDVCLKMVTHV